MYLEENDLEVLNTSGMSFNSGNHTKKGVIKSKTIKNSALKFLTNVDKNHVKGLLWCISFGLNRGGLYVG